jgi:hypothetical protein
MANKFTRSKTIRSKQWEDFSDEVLHHIEDYTVPQYGDADSDLAQEYTPESCLKQVEKYLKRFGKQARQGETKLDLLKMAHYIQMAYTKSVDL